MKTRIVTRTLVLVALMLNLGVAGVYAQQGRPINVYVRMTFSGNAGPSTINLNQPEHKNWRRESRRGRYAGPVYFSKCKRDRKYSVSVQHLLGPSSFQGWPARAYFASRMGVY